MGDNGGTRPPDWYPDPSGRHQLRYFDGVRWTEHVASGGRQSTDALGEQVAPEPAGPAEGGGEHAAAARSRDPAVFTEPVLVVSQKAKLIEVNNEYAIRDEQGRQIGAVRQVGQGTVKKVLRVVSSLDQFMTHKLQVVDADGSPLLVLTRPAKVFKSTMVVEDAHGREIGRIVQENMVGKIHFALVAGAAKVGAINAENWRAWNFNIRDGTGTEVARITKTWEGLAKTLFTTADNYVVKVHRPLAEPLRSLVIASALSVDTALKQDSRGFN